MEVQLHVEFVKILMELEEEWHGREEKRKILE
jgi:hypothetical protein